MQENEPTLNFPEQINIVCGYGESRVHFYLKMISMEEENEYMQQFAKLRELPKAEQPAAEYQIILGGIKAWSIAVPTVLKTVPVGDSNQTQEKHVPISELEDPAEAIEDIFGEYSVTKERLLNGVASAYMREITPNSDFF